MKCSVRLYSMSLVCYSLSHPRSDPCCVFLPELAVCTDTRSDNSTADTEQNLRVPDERKTDHALVWFRNVSTMYLSQVFWPYFGTRSKQGTGSWMSCTGSHLALVVKQRNFIITKKHFLWICLSLTVTKGVSLFLNLLLMIF